jgi:serine/threonine-protein kinase
LPQLYVRRLDQLEARVLPGTENAYAPFFSPDGQWIAYQDPIARKLRKVSVQGGQPLDLADAFPPMGGTWLEDGTIVFTTQEPGTFTTGGAGAGLFRVSDAGGTPERLTTVDAQQREVYHARPYALPGGEAVLFTTFSGPPTTGRVMALTVETGEVRTLVDVGYEAKYAPSGHLVFARQGALWAKRFDADRLETIGQEVVVLQALEVSANFAPYTFSADGLLAYMPGELGVVVGTSTAPRTLVWVDREGREEPLPLPVRQYQGPELSPDGQRVAVTVFDGQSSDLWVYDVRSGASLRLTQGGTDGFHTPVWSRDGARIFFRWVDPNTGFIDLYSVAADGSGVPEQILSTEEMESTTSISPDGETLVFARTLSSGGIEIVGMQLDGEPAETRLVEGRFAQGNATVSPDGRSLVYFSDESGQREIYLQPYPGPGAKTPVSIGGGLEARWSRDGGEIFFRTMRAVISVPVARQPDLVVGRPLVLFEADYQNGQALAGARQYDVAPDGRFLMIRAGTIQQGDEIDAYDHLILVDNWLDELRRLVPE